MPPDAQDIQQQNPAPTPEQITTAATAGPQPSSQLAATLTGSPAPTATPATAPAPAPPSPQQQAAAADVAHHSALGRAVSFLLGKQRQYVPDPKTGAPMAVDVPQKPGELFRHILASAIIGGAAGQGTNSPLAGFTRGASAGIQANMQADAQKRAQAQRDFENRQAVERQTHEQNIADQRIADEKLRTEAQIQLHNIQTLAEEHNMNLRDREYADRFNEHQNEIRQQTYDAGGIDAPIPGNGEVGNGAKLQKLRISQPAMFQAPSGYHTVYTTDISYDGLNNDPKKGWVDKNGNAIDLASRTTHFVQFVPHDAMKEPVTLKGSKVKKLRPDLSDLVEDDKEYTMPREHWFGVISSARKQAHDEARADWREKHDEINRQLSEMKDRADNLTRQINTLSRNPVPDEDTKAQIADLTAQRQQVWDDYDDAQAQAHPNSRLRKADSGRNANTAQANTAQIPPGAITATNPQTKQKSYSTDGGKTWQIAGGEQGEAKAKTSDEQLRSSVAPYMTVMRTPDGKKTINVLNGDVQNWQKQGYAVVGQGTASAEQATSEESDVGHVVH